MSTFAPLFVPAELREAVSGRAWLAGDARRRGGRSHARAPSPASSRADAAAAIAAACAAGRLRLGAAAAGGPAGRHPRRAARARARGAGRRGDRPLGAPGGDEPGRHGHRGDARHPPGARPRARRARPRRGRLRGASPARHRDTPMAGRTLLQQAVPTTFGLKAAGWLVAVLDARARLARAARRRARGAARRRGRNARRARRARARDRPPLRRASSTSPSPRCPGTRTASGSPSSAPPSTIAAGVLAKIGLDVVLLAQTEVAEVREGGEGGGSSAMPQKRNAVGAMRARACAELARAHASVLTGALAQEHERAAGAWQAEWEALSRRAPVRREARLPRWQGRWRGSRSTRRGCGRTSTSPAGRSPPSGSRSLLTDRLGRTAARALVRDASLRAERERAVARRGARRRSTRA